jgi:cytochrome P450
VRAGEIIIAVLATAPESLPFGHGRHGCPGADVATAIAIAGVTALLDRGVDPAALVRHLAYRPSPATRVPCFEVAS